MIRSFILAVGAGVFGTLAIAQTAAPPAAEGGTQTTYDPTRFLETMVNYRRLALTCEGTLPGSPLADSDEISAFFQTLGMAEPRAIDAQLQRLTKKLVRAQAASICAERLAEGAVIYGESARVYTQNKPDAWPAAPRISAGPWCASVTCAELSF
ncbi:hypothetical protein [Loktanella sp. R86503]|uniref:hypothetical protein n=1 Tax=Loktanella sp. R86503 TaxID=3093847 RepID=UPI0036D90462